MAHRSRQLIDALDCVPVFTCPEAVEDHANFFGWHQGELEILNVIGEQVLDLGSGREYFAMNAQQIARKYGRTICTVSLNPQLADEEAGPSLSRHTYPDTDYERKAVAGLFQALPFKDESFETVVSLGAFPLVFDDSKDPVPDDEYAKSYTELYRVLEPSGKAYLAPVIQKERNLGIINAVIPEAEVELVRPARNPLGCIVIQKATLRSYSLIKIKK